MDNFMEIFKEIMNSKIMHSILLIIIAYIADKIINRRLLKFVSRRMQNRNEDSAGRYKTLFSVISKIITVVLVFVVLLWVLQILFNVQPTSVIAATGIVGVAIGLGAQSLVKDSITGFFILMEDQFGVGDTVTIDGFCGTVHSVSLRMTCIENFEGDRMFIPNSSITKVINHSKADRKVIIDIPVSYDIDIDYAVAQMKDILSGLKEQVSAVTDNPIVLGVAELSSSSVNIKVLIPCSAADQYQCKRDALRVIRAEMAKREIEIPYNHITIETKEK